MTDVRSLSLVSADAHADGLKGIVSSGGEVIGQPPMPPEYKRRPRELPLTPGTIKVGCRSSELLRDCTMTTQFSRENEAEAAKIRREKTMTNKFNLLLALVIGVLLLGAAPLQARAQFVQVKVDNIVAGVMTDNDDPFNTCDEVYFLLAGASDHAGPIQTRIGPCGSRDIFELCPDNRTKQNIKLWQGFIPNGQSAFLTVLVREQDDAQLSAIISLVKGAAELFGAIFINPALGGDALNDLKAAAVQFVDSLSNGADDTIGAFTIRITNQNNVFTASWDTVRDTNIVSQSATSAHFNATGADTNYSVNVSIQPLTLTESGNLLWYKHDGWLDGTSRWANGSSRRVEHSCSLQDKNH